MPLVTQDTGLLKFEILINIYYIYIYNQFIYRQELQKRLPWMGVREPDTDSVSSNTGNVSTTTTVAEPKQPES